MYHQRRQQFMEQMQGGVAIFRNPPADRGYQPSNDFYYLTGLDEPNAACLLIPDHDEHRFVLFVQPKDRNAEIWTGIRIGIDAAKERFGADMVYSIEELDSTLPQYLDAAETLYYRTGSDEDFNTKVIDLFTRYQGRRAQEVGPHTLTSSSEILHEMRVKKDETEIALMRQAALITEKAHCAAMAHVRPGMFEYELEALMCQIYRSQGGVGPAYPPIIASGANALILHYETNNRQIEEGDLVLMDTGAEYGYYDADVTRTIPANGKFTEVQRSVYEVVLEAQRQVIATIRPGKTYADYNQAAYRALTEGLTALGILSGDVDDLVAAGAYRPFYMHSAGHWIGLETHDVGKYRVNGKPREFEPGMVITPDTALYIAAGSEGVDPRFWDIGIRIEDDALVTESGCEILTAGIPKTVEDIEQAMAG